MSRPPAAWADTLRSWRVTLLTLGGQMRSKALQVLAIVATMGTASAMAADLPVRAPIVKAPMAPVVQTWTGCYIGGNIGGAWSNSHYTVDNEVVVESFSFDPTSVIGGGQVGCN